MGLLILSPVFCHKVRMRIQLLGFGPTPDRVGALRHIKPCPLYELASLYWRLRRVCCYCGRAKPTQVWSFVCTPWFTSALQETCYIWQECWPANWTPTECEVWPSSLLQRIRWQTTNTSFSSIPFMASTRHETSSVSPSVSHLVSTKP